MAKQHIIIEFADGASKDFWADLSLDDDYNTSVYGEKKNYFRPTEIAYLKLIQGPDPAPYTLESSFGSLSTFQTNVIYSHEQRIDFAYTKKATLDYLPIVGSVSYSWHGNNGGTPLFTEDQVILPVETPGILDVVYAVKGTRLKLSNANMGLDEYTILCVAIYTPTEIVSCDVDFQGEEDVDELTDISILVKDVCTDEPVINAVVTIAGIGTGTTDSFGIWSPTKKVLTGVSYGISAVASGYVPSDSDFLKNDSFVIPKST